MCRFSRHNCERSPVKDVLLYDVYFSASYPTGRRSSRNSTMFFHLVSCLTPSLVAIFTSFCSFSLAILTMKVSIAIVQLFGFRVWFRLFPFFQFLSLEDEVSVYRYSQRIYSRRSENIGQVKTISRYTFRNVCTPRLYFLPIPYYRRFNSFRINNLLFVIRLRDWVSHGTCTSKFPMCITVLLSNYLPSASGLETRFWES